PPEIEHYINQLLFKSYSKPYLKRKYKGTLWYSTHGFVERKIHYYTICHCFNCHDLYWSREHYSFCMKCYESCCLKCTNHMTYINNYGDICSRCYCKLCFRCNIRTKGQGFICWGCTKYCCMDCIYVKSSRYCKSCNHKK